MGHPSQLRVSDTEREAVVARLGQATGEGRLALHEFDVRSRQAYASRTRIELYALVDDLPSPGTMPSGTSGISLPALALTFGVLSLPLGFCPPVGLICAAVGILLALVALGGAGRGAGGRRGMAVAALVCGAAGVVHPIALSIMFGF